MSTEREMDQRCAFECQAPRRPYQVKYTEYLEYFDKIDVEWKELHQSVYMHWHEFCELEFIVSGDGIHRTKNETLPFQAGVIFLQLPMDFHEVIVSEDNPPKLYSVKFTETFIDPEIYQAVFRGNLQRQVTLSGADFESVRRDFEQLYSEFQGDDSFRDHLLKSILEKIVIQLERRVLRENRAPTGPPTPLHETDHVPPFSVLLECLTYIQKNYAQNITLTELAGKASMSPNYFSTFFRQNTGCTFRDYLKRVRMRFAVSLLANSDLPIYKISEMVGFNSYAHFERLFLKEVGVTPGGFRSLLLERREDKKNQRVPSRPGADGEEYHGIPVLHKRLSPTGDSPAPTAGPGGH